MPTKLIMIRHGETPWTAKKRYCGSIDIGLSEKGKKQAVRLRGRLCREFIHKVYTSPKKRAYQTARIVFSGRKACKVFGLAEMHFGVFEGLTYRQISDKYPELYRRWLKDPFSVLIPDGERPVDFRRRVARSIKKIISLNKNKAIAIVSHGGPIGVFITSFLKTRDFWKWIPKPCGVLVIEKKGSKYFLCQK